ncbi:MAG: bifunctional hydroxymethylpyrimidine kinase/phosphomethylpyrimidine kinase [Pseudomonadota bacterium]
MPTDTPPPRVLTIAGSDCSGGAGIQADLKTIAMLGGYGMSAITAATAQNSIGVQAIVPMSGEFVGTQIRSCISDIGVDAIKLGMLHDEAIITAVAQALSDIDPAIPVVLDPVMVASSGAVLIADPAIEIMREQLFGRATLITPNLPELEHLHRRTLRTTALAEAAAEELRQTYGCAVLAKGGHTDDAQIIDLLVTGNGPVQRLTHARIDTRHTHGTGCTLSSAIATLLAHGQPLDHAVKLARQFVLHAIKAAPGFGAGSGPLGHHAVRKLE